MRAFAFRGVAVAAVTPFDARGKLDLPALEDLIAWWIAEGIEGLVLCGSTGELAYLQPQERLSVIEAGLRAAAGRVPVIAGTGYPDTGTTIQVTRAAEALGVDAALVVTPYYYPLSSQALRDHYAAVAAATRLPVLVYNMPPFTHVHLEAKTVADLARIEGVCGIKDSAGDLAQLRAIRAATPPSFCVLTGSFPLLVEAIRAGADGAILGIANLIPAACVRLARLARTEPEAARALLREHEDLQAWVKAHGIPGIKARLGALGRAAGLPRRPLPPLSVDVAADGI